MQYQRDRNLILQQMRITTSTPSLETLIATICLTIFKADLDQSIRQYMTHMIFAPITRKESYRPSMLQCSRLFFATLKYLSEQKIAQKDRPYQVVNGGYPRMQLLKRVDCPFYQTKGTTIFFLVTESIKLLLCKSQLIFFRKFFGRLSFFAFVL